VEPVRDYIENHLVLGNDFIDWEDFEESIGQLGIRQRKWLSDYLVAAGALKVKGGFIFRSEFDIEDLRRGDL
jgi:hypothetical protein